MAPSACDFGAMVLLAVLVLALLLVPLLGGRLGRLAEIDLKAMWAIAVGLGLQILIISIIPNSFEWSHEPIHFLSYGFAAVFVWANRRIPGMLIIALGAFCNFLAIAANGGVMPASPTAQSSAGIVQNEGGGFANSAALEDPNLLFLGDIFAIPDAVPILDNVFSVGDILIAMGIVILIHGVCGSKLVPDRFRGAFSTAG